MPIAILVLAFAAYLYALIAEPGFRRWGLVLGAAIGFGLAVYFWLAGGSTAPPVTAEDIILDELVLERSGRGATLKGRIYNGAETARLREVALMLRLHDCPEPDMDPAECPVIGEAEALSRPDVPPGQIRGLTAHFVFANVPPVTGTLAWDWEILDLRATAP